MNTIPLPDINTQKLIIEMGKKIEELEASINKEKAQTSIKAEYLKPFNNSEYKPASYIELRTLKEEIGLSGSDIANICGTTPRTVRSWMSEDGAQNAKKIPYSAWRLLLIETNVV